MGRLRIATDLAELQGTRLVLRAMRDDDAALLLDLYADPVVMQYTDEQPFPDLDTVHMMLRSVRRLLASGESLEWAIALRNTGWLVGTCGLHSFDTNVRSAELGCLLRRSAWGNGYMAEAVALVMAYAADILELDHIKADVAAENHRAQSFFKRIAFQQAGSETWVAELPRHGKWRSS